MTLTAMKLKIKTSPDLSDTSPAHQQALAAGNDHFSAWQYNVADHFKDKTIDEIKDTLKETANPFAVCCEHLIGDFNLGTVIRNANAFNAKEVFYVGDKKWDRRSAVGVHNYTSVQWLATIDDLVKLQEKYVIVGVDNVPGSVPISSYNFVPNTLFVFGEEGVGLTPAMQSFCQDIIEIPMYGSVRSLNCGVASGIVMHSFVEKIRGNNVSKI
jgi:tRNA G18 (ribose-2'-O)-methylase SpoU